MRHRARVALIDLEGTVGSIAFVRDVLFPFAAQRMDAYVRAHEREPAVREILDQTADEADVARSDLDALLEALHDWADRDVKVTPLKQLQGLIWVEGFESSGIQGHLYRDAIDALRRFYDAGVACTSTPRARFPRRGSSVTASRATYCHSFRASTIRRSAQSANPLRTSAFSTRSAFRQ